MKKCLIYILITLSLFICIPSYSTDYEGSLTKIENDIYGFDYSKDNNQNRIARLEKTIYGKTFAGDLAKRIKKLNNDIASDVIGLEIEPVKDTFLAVENAKEESNVNYPFIDETEQKLFNRTYKNRDFHTRIVTIEKKLFGKIYDVDDYSTRIDRIKSKMMPETIAKQDDIYGNGSYYDDKTLKSIDLSGIDKNRFGMPFGQKNYTREYANYGNFIPEPNDYDSLNDDLSKMEYDMFGTEFSNESTHNRIKRLNSVNKAKKSSQKYDSQKFAQHMSTAMEIGAMILMILAMVL